ncbi:hypothetical protein N8298_04170 [Flavobacteriaceae bacterium]|nr:hypothetical protein [Flavobacteriaceae bacterium]
MKFYINYILFLIFFSCDFTSNKELVVEDLVSNDLKTFNWNDVDTYPRFQNCDTIINKESNFDCFVNTITSNLQSNLINNSVVVNSSLSDTLIINFSVTNKGDIVLSELSNESVISKLNVLIDSIFKHTVSDLPKLYPAIKRGQPVKTKFILPILISTTD